MNNVSSNPEKKQEKELTKQSSKDCHRQFGITILVILLVEAPQVFCAWLTIAEKIPIFLNQHSLPTEVIQNLVK